MEFKRKEPEIVHMGRVREEGEMDKIELAILANGGEKHLKNWCQCDADVGAVLCEYCAIYNGLMYARELLEWVEESETQLHEIKYNFHQEMDHALKAEKRVEELEDGIRKWWDHCEHDEADEELYTFIKKKGG